jgi:hypothetical protein
MAKNFLTYLSKSHLRKLYNYLMMQLKQTNLYTFLQMETLKVMLTYLNKVKIAFQLEYFIINNYRS